MMPHHPDQVGRLADAHQAGLRAEAAGPGRIAAGRAGHRGATRSRPVAATRRRAGWLLIGIGTRMVLG